MSSYMSVTDIARRCGVSEKVVIAWIKGGKLSAMRPGRKYLVDVESFTRFQDEHRVVPSPEASTENEAA